MFKDFVALDFEFMPSQRYIIQVGYVVVRGGQIVRKVEQMVKPPCSKMEYNHNPIIKELTNISYDILENAPTFEEVWQDLYNQINNNIVVAHNACSAELSVLTKELDRLGVARNDSDWPKFRCFCTMELAKSFEHYPYRLDSLCKEFNIELSAHHNAASDAEATAKLFIELSKIHNLSACKSIQYDCHYHSSKSCNNSSMESSKKPNDGNMPKPIKQNNEFREKNIIKVSEIQVVFEEPIVNLSCFRDDIIVLTGLDASDKEHLTMQLTNIGATIKSSITKNTTCIIAGNNAGWAKLEKAVEMNIPVINRYDIKI